MLGGWRLLAGPKLNLSPGPSVQFAHALLSLPRSVHAHAPLRTHHERIDAVKYHSLGPRTRKDIASGRHDILYIAHDMMHAAKLIGSSYARPLHVHSTKLSGIVTYAS